VDRGGRHNNELVFGHTIHLFVVIYECTV